MDEFLATVGVQAMRYAIRSGIALTSTYALGQCSRLLKSVDDSKLHIELRNLQKLLDGKMKIITPAIDLIEFKSGRGNVFLESAVPLTKSLHQQINSLGRRIASVAELGDAMREQEAAAPAMKPMSERHEALRQVIVEIKGLLERIDREIPLLQLAITASGESLSTSLPASISPSRLLQASTLLIVGDTQYAQDPTRSVQIGPPFTLSLYMLFLGHASSKFNDSNQTNVPIYGLGDDDRKPLWQEVIHKAKVRLCRSAQHQIPNSSTGDERPTDLVTACEIPEYSYYLEIIEDFNDGRVHEDLELQSLRCGVRRASIRETIPVYQISKIFYADTGRILNIGKAEDGENSPVLLLKRDLEANRSFAKGTDACGSIKKATEEDQENAAAVEEDFFDEQACIDQQLQEESAHTASASLKNRLDAVGGGSRLPKHFDPEWIAFEVYEDDETVDDSETEGESDSDAEELEGGEQMHGATPAAEAASPDVELAAQLRSLSLQPPPEPGAVRDVASSFSAQTPEVDEAGALDFVARSPFKNVTTSLSLIEMLIRLAGLQEFQQVSHLSIPDHILTFFLEETSTTGLTGEARRTVRSEAKRHVGFDPYTDTPTE